MFIILTEYVGVRHRHQPGTVMWYSWPVAIGIMSTCGCLTRDWRLLSIVLGAQGLPVLFAWWYVCSPLVFSTLLFPTDPIFYPFEHVQAICGTFFTGTVRCTLLTYSIFYPFDPNQKDRLCRNRVV